MISGKTLSTYVIEALTKQLEEGDDSESTLDRQINAMKNRLNMIEGQLGLTCLTKKNK